jgi:hypothetical protein
MMAAALARTLRSPTSLTRCAECRSPFVTPIARERRDGATWTIRLRCGECGFLRDVLVTGHGIERLERDLRQGAAAISESLAHMERTPVLRGDLCD